ncbi:helix-turn-helix domain-containing protein [Dyadobacter sp. CY312]|uniref:helix-turn-helix domain-containing protein n=1 Tax=Dyadobacter sp. CY312 TaxID=2907303 RepID=UPI001F3D0741|nr:helix-turn-helix domain-containing protein [Dyadobacter sp. CY312]MCE7043296.1 helix-turn-helix domain-containing protein [Dyadobacter sp. CY312]
MNKVSAVLFFVLLTCTAFAQLRIEVVATPPLATPSSSLYLASDLNNWSPGDPNYRFRKDTSGVYFIDIPKNPTRFEFKITQGNWTMVEGDSAGAPLRNRLYDASSLPDKNLLQVRINGWEQKIVYTFIIKKLPENTPHDAQLYITGNFNDWEAANPLYKVYKNVDGTYRTTIYTEKDPVEYKFTRGEWNSIEGRASGKARPNRLIYRDSKINHMSVDVEIDGWEDLTASFHFYSIYDLLLLFAVFQGILLIIAIPTIQNYNRSANRWLVITIGVASLMILLRTIGSYREAAQAFTKVLLMPDFILFLYVPLFYFYLQKLLFNQSAKPVRQLLFFLPAILQCFVYLPFFLMGERTLQLSFMMQDWKLMGVFLGTGLLALAWNTYFWFLFRKTFRFYREQYQSHFSYEQNLNYLNTVLFIQAICLGLWYFLFIMLGLGHWFEFDVTQIVERSVDAIWLAFSTITYFVGYFAIHQPEIFKISPQALSIFGEIKSSPVVMGSEEEVIDKKVEQAEDLHEARAQVEDYMIKHKPYTNPKLSLNELAGKIKLPPHTLSKVINDGFDKNFFDFINSYRVDEFKKRVDNPKFKNYTLLSIAYEVGFNSKTAFNRSFKKMTGQTPRDYYNESRLEE